MMARHRPKNRIRRGFTLIEALVATVLVAIAVVAVMGGIRAMTAARTRAADAELLQRLAMQKMNELGTVADPATADEKGDFTTQGYQDISWTVAVEPSGVTNLDQVTVTATRGQTSQALTGLIFVRPTTTGGATQ